MYIYIYRILGYKAYISVGVHTDQIVHHTFIASLFPFRTLDDDIKTCGRTFPRLQDLCETTKVP